VVPVEKLMRIDLSNGKEILSFNLLFLKFVVADFSLKSEEE